ncbi:MAG: porin [Rickettsiales bacterium]|nr:porin [Rickettsiales bacterium]
MSLFAGAAAAETPKVTLGGVADFQVGYVSEDLDTNQRAQAFRSDTEVTVRVDGKTDGGLGYGAGVDIETDTTADAYTQGTNASKTFLYVEGANWGRVEAGSTTGAATALKVDASRIARATGGIDGDFTYFLDAPGTQYLVTPDLVLDYGAGTLGNESQENANKVSYYTPRFAGFQAGISYIVDLNRGQGVNRFDNNTGAGGVAVASAVDNIFEGGINYEGKFGDVGFAAAVTGTTGSATVATTEDLRAWNAGAKLSYQGFSVAGSYGDWGDSLRTATDGTDETSYWTAGLAYETGPFGASVTYLSSEYDIASTTTDAEFTNIAVGVDYKLAPGLTPYAEVNFIEFDEATAASDNDATVFIAGTQLSF